MGMIIGNGRWCLLDTSAPVGGSQKRCGAGHAVQRVHETNWTSASKTTHKKASSPTNKLNVFLYFIPYMYNVYLYVQSLY
jgi:hypothetical protein